MQFRLDSNSSVVNMSGEFTFTDHAQFKSLVTRLFEANGSAVVIDLSKLEFIDSAGLGMLLLARDEAKKANRALVLRGPSGQVKRMFGVTKFDALFDVQE
jgi:HptB-dependent secretion and biofilm anti anti-sigma factor